MNKSWEHFKLICKHKKYVFKMCKQVGIMKQGLFHDLSKFSPTEFFESAKFFSGDRSPIDNCKEKNGYSLAWFHHRGRNKHHWEYWVDNFEKGTQPTLMPFKYALEMLCDYIGAGMAYQGDKFTYESEYEWWLKKRKVVVMHPVVWRFIDAILHDLAVVPTTLNYTYCENIYNYYLKLFNEGKLEK